MPPRTTSITEVLRKGTGTLYQRGKNDVYTPLGDKELFTIKLLREEGKTKTAFSLAVELDGESVLVQPLSDAMRLEYSNETASIHWPAIIDNAPETLAFKFSAPSKTLRDAQNEVNQFVIEFNRCTYFELMGTYAAGEIHDLNDVDKDESYQYLAGSNTATLPNEDFSDPMFVLDSKDDTQSVTGAGNNCFADSAKNHRALVLRKANESMQLQAHAYGASGLEDKNVQAVSIKGLTSSKMALPDFAERKLMLLDTSSSAHKICEVDIERGEVVQKFKLCSEEPSVESFTYGKRFANVDPNLFTCITDDSAFSIDTRLKSDACVVCDDGKSWSDYRYKFKNEVMTCCATTAQGHLVIGDSKGSVRLYTGPPGGRKADGNGHHAKLAKTLLELKEPILHVDVSADGKYILATVDSCVLVMCTVFNGGENGFEKRMGANKPQPLRLTPSPAQIMDMGGPDKVHFTTATIEMSARNEQWVSAACGSWILTWSMESITNAIENRRMPFSSSYNTSAGSVKDVTINVNDGGRNAAKKITYLTGNTLGMQVVSDEKIKHKSYKPPRYN